MTPRYGLITVNVPFEELCRECIFWWFLHSWCSRNHRFSAETFQKASSNVFWCISHRIRGCFYCIEWQEAKNGSKSTPHLEAHIGWLSTEHRSWLLNCNRTTGFLCNNRLLAHFCAGVFSVLSDSNAKNRSKIHIISRLAPPLKNHVNRAKRPKCRAQSLWKCHKLIPAWILRRLGSYTVFSSSNIDYFCTFSTHFWLWF